MKTLLQYADRVGSSLHDYCILGNIADLKKHLRNKENRLQINKLDSIGESALHKPRFRDNNVCQVIKLLIKNGADVNLKNRKGEFPLMQNIHVNNLRMIRHWKLNGTNLTAENKCKQNLLHYLCSNISFICNPFQNLEKIQYLMEECGLKIIKDKYGNTPIHQLFPSIGFPKKTIEIIEYLRKNGLDLESKNNRGETPLFLACNHSHFPDQDMKIVMYLLKNIQTIHHTGVVIPYIYNYFQSDTSAKLIRFLNSKRPLQKKLLFSIRGFQKRLPSSSEVPNSK